MGIYDFISKKMQQLFMKFYINEPFLHFNLESFLIYNYLRF